MSKIQSHSIPNFV